MISGKRDAAAWQKKHEPTSPHVGDEAPDFELMDAAGKSPVRLSDYRGKRPVVLVFGSFT